MKIDFHCHIDDKASISCSDVPEVSQNPSSSLLSCIGLLPDKWTVERQALLFSRLLENPALQMGEIGLDRRFASSIPIGKQAEILKQELDFATTHSRCISLHCVQATGPMLDILSSISFRPFSILWHGFSGSKETAARLASLKVMVSVGPGFKGILRDFLDANGHLVPETDYTGTDWTEHARLTEEMYESFSKSLGWDMVRLERHCSDMFTLFSEREIQNH